MARLSRQGMMALDVRNMPVMGWWELGWPTVLPYGGMPKPSLRAQAKQSIAEQAAWIASSRSLSSGAHSRDPLAPRNDDKTQMLSSTNSRHTPRKRIGVKIVGPWFDIDVFFWAVRGGVGGSLSWIVAGDRLWAGE